MTIISSTPVLDLRANTSDIVHSPQELKRQIGELQGKIRFYTPPPIGQINHDLQRAVVKATIDPALRGEVAHFNQMLLEANQTIEQHEADQRQLAHLQSLLAAAEHEQKQAVINLANAALEKATAAYLHTGEQLVAAYRALLEQQAHSQRIPGAKTAIPGGFDFVPANPMGWDGATSAMMRDGRLPSEPKRIYSATLDQLIDARAA